MKAMAPDWTSLPADLINRIADSVLSTDDLDYYMDFRAVCRALRASTADPKSNPRFHPRRWAMLDEERVHRSDDAHLLVNVATGRFVRKDLPMLCRYFLVAGADGGLLVLADRSAPHAALVLNPFTGGLVVFRKQHRMEVFKLKMVDANLLEPVKGIGGRALFLGGCRGLSVDATKFTSVDANCVYYVIKDGPFDICVYSIKKENQVRIGGVMDPLYPVELVKLLCRHVFMVSESQFTWEKLRFRKLHPNWIIEDLLFLQ